MKSEERHQLQQNSLATFMNDLPGSLRKHSSKLLMVLALVLLAIAIYNRRQVAKTEREQSIQVSLANAWTQLNQLQQEESRGSFGMPSEDRLRRRNDAVTRVQESVQHVIDDSDPAKDKTRLANAWIVSGELYWTLANAAPIPPSTQPTTQSSTQPALSPEQYLESAEKAYQKVLSDYADQRTPATVARFGLAAIAENRHDWPAAREQYKSIIESTTTPPAEKAMAEARIAKLDDLQKPLLLVPAREPVAGPTSMPDLSIPSMLGPMPPMTKDEPTSKPTTGPAENLIKTGASGAVSPATAPATKP